jgi:hypothetical protein
MEQKSTFWRSAMVYGLYVGIILTLFSVILYVTGQTLNKTLGYLSIPIYIAAIAVAQINYRNRDLDGVMSYGQALGFAAALMLFSGIITALYALIIYKIDPGLIEQAKNLQEQKLAANGMSDDQIDAAMQMAGKFMTPGFMAISGLLGSVIMGTIIGLVTSIFTQKKGNPDLFDDAMSEIKTEE